MKIYLDMVGCRLNQAEIEQMARQFRSEGHTIVAKAAEADAMVINTCSVTAEAASDSRLKIRQASRAGVRQIVVTGCWSTLQPLQAATLPNVVHVIPNQRKDTLVRDFLDFEPSRNPFQKITPISNPSGNSTFDLEPISRIPIPGLRQRTRAFIKVQDGCNNACSFCVTTIARGASCSRPLADVISDIQSALKGGAQEVVLTGVHLGSWGQDFGQNLHHIIAQILKQTDIPRLRLSSLEPWDLHTDFFSLWADQRLCPHLHLPMQSGSAATLKRMLRKTDPRSFQELVCAAQKQIPGVAITTDIIAGFPGENDAEFDETLAFIKKMNFAGGHVFTYSARPDTPAARMKEQVPLKLRKQRSHLLHATFAELSTAYRTGFIGQTLPVLWEASAIRTEQGWQIEGLTGNYIRVTTSAPELRWNRLDKVKLTGVTKNGMTGEIT